MFFTIDYNYNTETWEAEECEYFLFNYWYNHGTLFANQDIRNRIVYVGY